MAIQIELAKDLPDDVEIVLVPACSDQLGGGDADWDYLRARGFEAAVDQIFTVPGQPAGLDRDARRARPVRAGVTPAGIRRAVGGGRARRPAATRWSATHLLDALPPTATPAERAQRRPGAGRGHGHRRLPVPRPTSRRPSRRRSPGWSWSAAAASASRTRSHVGARIGEAVTYARDLVNTPGGTLTPAVLAESAVEIAERENLQITVLGPDEIAEARLGGLLGVNRGLDPAAPLHRDHLRARRQAAGLAGAGRQGHHLRLRWPVASRPARA